MMDLHDFTNRLKVLRSIDRHELITAGLGHMTDEREWVFFREHPLEWIVKADDHNAAAVWALVESRCKPKEPEAHPILAKLEPEAYGGSIASAAVSLKRIADALHGDDQNAGMKYALATMADRAFNGWGPTS